jgi:hypothetical protein
MIDALALPARDDLEPSKKSSESDLGDDVVTLSYEHALRAHGRYKPVERHDWQSEPPAQDDDGLTSRANRVSRDAFDGDLRTASVTIRLSNAENAQLHKLAAEAGVTVSAYLRSCTFEAEALRAEVKTALTELRSAALRDTPVMHSKKRHTFLGWIAFGWMARLLPPRHSASPD